MSIYIKVAVMSIITSALSLGSRGIAHAQTVAEVSGGVGVTLVDLTQWSNAFARSGRDWSTTTVQFRGLVLPISHGPFSWGIDLATQSLFWYTYNACPGCDSFVEGTTAVAATSVMGAGRVRFGAGAFADFSSGLFIVGGERRLGAAGAIGYAVPINKHVSMPVKLRTDYVFGELAVPAGSVGLAFRF